MSNPITPEIFKAIEPRKYVEKFLESKIRPDGRDFTDHRSLLEVRTNVIESSISSASVRSGNTTVIAAVKAGIFSSPVGVNRVGNKEQGQLNVTCDYSLCMLGERRLAQLEASRISYRIEKVLNIDGVFDKSQLDVVFLEEDDDNSETVKSQKSVWDVTIDLLVVRDDGSVLDCALLAAMTALKNAKLAKINRENMNVALNKSIPLVMGTVEPVSACLCIHNKSYLIEPTREEEDVLPRIWIVVDVSSQSVLGLYGPELPRHTLCQYDRGTSQLGLGTIFETIFPLVVKHCSDRTSTVVNP